MHNEAEKMIRFLFICTLIYLFAPYLLWLFILFWAGKKLLDWDFERTERKKAQIYLKEKAKKESSKKFKKWLQWAQ